MPAPENLQSAPAIFTTRTSVENRCQGRVRSPFWGFFKKYIPQMGAPLFLLQPLTVECETWIKTHVEYNKKIGGALALDFFYAAGGFGGAPRKWIQRRR